MDRASRRRDARAQSSTGPSAAAQESQEYSVWIYVGLALASLLVFAPVFGYGFLDYDDQLFITENTMVKRGLTWDGITWAFSTGFFVSWHPLTWISHMLDIQLFGLNAGGHHAVSLLIHTATSLLLYRVLRQMTGKGWRSAFVAALFALHPLHVESVAWVSERKDVLSAFFWTLTIASYLRYLKESTVGRYMVLFLTLALGLMCKSMLVTTPAVLLLLDFWPLNRLTKETAWPLIQEKIPLMVLAAVTSAITYEVQKSNIIDVESFSLSVRLGNAATSYLAYLGRMLWPANLTVFYPYRRDLPDWWTASAVIILIGLTTAALRQHRVRPHLTMGWLFYLGTLIPVIGFVQAGEQAMADRYTYIPLTGAFIAVVWTVSDVLEGQRARAAALAASVLLACVSVSMAQVRHWSGNEALWSHAMKVTKRNYIAHHNYGSALLKRGDLEGAAFHFKEALRFEARYPQARSNLGGALMRLGRVSEAIPHLQEALKITAKYPEAQSNLATAYMSQGKYKEAQKLYRDAIRLEPDYAEAHNNLGILLATIGEKADAYTEFREAVRLKPAFADPHYNLGVMLAQDGKLSEAVEHLEAALHLAPGHQDARQVLSDVQRRRK